MTAILRAIQTPAIQCEAFLFNLRLTQLTTSGNLQNLSYLYDNVGNITRITDTIRSETLNFVYDDLDRLTNVTACVFAELGV